MHCSITRLRLCLCVRVCPNTVRVTASDSEGQACEEVWPRFHSDSVLLQDQVLQLVRRPEQEGGGLPVACDELPHCCDLWRAELSRSSAAATSLTVTVGAGRGGIWAN